MFWKKRKKKNAREMCRRKSLQKSSFRDSHGEFLKLVASDTFSSKTSFRLKASYPQIMKQTYAFDERIVANRYLLVHDRCTNYLLHKIFSPLPMTKFDKRD